MVCVLLLLYLIAIVARVLLSWFPLDPDGMLATIGGFLYLVTDPVLLPLRRVLPPVRLGSVALDLSPIIVIVGVQILSSILC
ncbi:MAG: YggT family protein [Acidimicrobiales bacterium]